MNSKDAGRPPDLALQSKTQQKKDEQAHAKQQKRQERQRKKGKRRRQQRQQIQAALRAIGATWDGKAHHQDGQRYYVVHWQGADSSFEKPGAILRWARQHATPREMDYAEMEIARLIEAARHDMQEEDIP